MVLVCAPLFVYSDTYSYFFVMNGKAHIFEKDFKKSRKFFRCAGLKHELQKNFQNENIWTFQKLCAINSCHFHECTIPIVYFSDTYSLLCLALKAKKGDFQKNIQNEKTWPLLKLCPIDSSHYRDSAISIVFVSDTYSLVSFELEGKISDVKKYHTMKKHDPFSTYAQSTPLTCKSL